MTIFLSNTEKALLRRLDKETKEKIEGLSESIDDLNTQARSLQSAYIQAINEVRNSGRYTEEGLEEVEGQVLIDYKNKASKLAAEVIKLNTEVEEAFKDGAAAFAEEYEASSVDDISTNEFNRVLFVLNQADSIRDPRVEEVIDKHLFNKQVIDTVKAKFKEDSFAIPSISSFISENSYKRDKGFSFVGADGELHVGIDIISPKLVRKERGVWEEYEKSQKGRNIWG